MYELAHMIGSPVTQAMFGLLTAFALVKAVESFLLRRKAMKSQAHAAGGNGIGWAVSRMWEGHAVTRKGWNGKNMYLKIQVPDEQSANTLPYVWMRTAQGDRVPWLCSQTDLLARDWEIVS